MGVSDVNILRTLCFNEENEWMVGGVRAGAAENVRSFVFFGGGHPLNPLKFDSFCLLIPTPSSSVWRSHRGL